MKPVRSCLFVPGVRRSWIDRVVTAGAALIVGVEARMSAAASARLREAAC